MTVLAEPEALVERAVLAERVELAAAAKREAAIPHSIKPIYTAHG